MESRQVFRPGEYVLFGTHIETGKPEEWVVLMANSEESTVLIASTEAVATIPYGGFMYEDMAKPATWKNSHIRKWLNQEYYGHFRRWEKEAIQPVPIPDPEDDSALDLCSVFILSEGEASLFFENDEARVLLCNYGYSRYPEDSWRNSCSWWLNDPPFLNEETGIMQVPVCTEHGELGKMADINSMDVGVRACMWVEGGALKRKDPFSELESLNVHLLEAGKSSLILYHDDREQVMDVLAAIYDYDLCQSFALLRDEASNQPVLARVNIDLLVKPTLAEKYRPLINTLKYRPYDLVANHLQQNRDVKTVAAWLKQEVWDPTPGFFQPEIDDSGNCLICFGHNTVDGREAPKPLFWRVIKRRSNKLLCVCETGLILDEFLHYRYLTNPEAEQDWATSSIRGWLNVDFLKSAFSVDEENRLMYCRTVEETEFSPPRFDRVFLLSDAEVSIFMPAESSRIISGTPSYEDICGDYPLPDTEEQNDAWWLRTPGRKAECFCCVTADGKIDRDGRNGHEETCAVRPAVLVELTGISIPFRKE